MTTTQLADLHGEIEYYVGSPRGDASRKVARARIISRVRFPRECDMSYPHPFRTALNDKGMTCISITQRSLDDGESWPVESAPEPTIHDCGNAETCFC